MILFSGSTLLAGPKHSTSVPSSSEVALPLSVDVKKVALVVPNSGPDLAAKVLFSPHIDVAPVVPCNRPHSLLPPTLQMVTPRMSPVTVHLKVKVLPGQMEGAAVNCPLTSPGRKNTTITHL